MLPEQSHLGNMPNAALYSETDVLDIERMRRSIDVITAAEFKARTGCQPLMTGASINQKLADQHEKLYTIDQKLADQHEKMGASSFSDLFCRGMELSHV